jgi:SAM-dependent methyltransferase
VRLVFYRETPDEQFWSRHWEAESLDHLLEVAARSPLTRFIERFVSPGDRVLEGGCGLGQYVRYFAERGVHIVGVDFSEQAVATHRRAFPDSDVRVADVAALPFSDGSFDVYLSLGVIEHYRDGGQEILAEARRVLADAGVLVLSTPYVNLARRALRSRFESRQLEVARNGGVFYQYAFDESTLDATLEAAGFRVEERSYYDPGHGLREVLQLLGARARASAAARHDGAGSPRRLEPLRRLVLEAKPTLKTFAHMQVVAAGARRSA